MPIDNPHHRRRWVILGVIAIAQLMIVLDLTIVNIALPSAQHDLGFSDEARQWIITAYALAFGSLLLLGGRLGDLFGRKWAFVGGLLGFAAASAVGGAAPSFDVLVAARATQGVFGALLAPAALGLLSTIFTDPSERATAFGIFGAIGGGGSAVGLLLGGVLTETLSWRWCLYISLIFAVPAALAAARLLVNEAQRNRPQLDLPGIAAGSLGLFALVYGFANSEMRSWGSPITIAMLAGSAGLLGLFVLIESRTAHPLLPLRVLRNRVRSGSYAAIGLSGVALFAVFLFLTYYIQNTKGFSPIETGLAFLPMTAAIMVTATTTNIVLLRRVGPRTLMTLGMALGAGAMVWLSQLTAGSSYVGHVLPALVILGVGMGNIFAPGFVGATHDVAPHDTGVASAMVNTMQQVGGSIGTALLSSIFAGAVAARLPAGRPTPGQAVQATMHGYSVAFWVAAGVFALGAVVVGAMLPRTHVEPEPPAGAVEGIPEQRTAEPIGV
jgi:EmrB/QacA subfamily drug resistance transporter